MNRSIGNKMAPIMSPVFPLSSLCYPTGQTLTRNGGLGYKDLPCLGKCTLILKLHFSFDGPMDFPDVCFSFTADDFGPKWKQNIVEHLSLLLQIAVSGLRVDIAFTMGDCDLRDVSEHLMMGSMVPVFTFLTQESPSAVALKTTSMTAV